MALQSSGQISLADIASEFSDTPPHSMSEFYGATSGLPSSGAINFSDFFGVSNGPATLRFPVVGIRNIGIKGDSPVPDFAAVDVTLAGTTFSMYPRYEINSLFITTPVSVFNALKGSYNQPNFWYLNSSVWPFYKIRLTLNGTVHEADINQYSLNGYSNGQTPTFSATGNGYLMPQGIALSLAAGPTSYTNISGNVVDQIRNQRTSTYNEGDAIEFIALPQYL